MKPTDPVMILSYIGLALAILLAATALAIGSIGLGKDPEVRERNAWLGAIAWTLISIALRGI